MKDFEKAYRRWLDMHLSKRRGERLRRLKEGHGYGEKLLVEQVWWPVVGSLDFLHPEYEVVDREGNYYYLDYAYMRSPKPTVIEADGFNPHARGADRRTFRNDRRRQNALVLAGWNILRFSVDDMKEDPEHCRGTLRIMLENWYGEESREWADLPLPKREIVRLAARSSEPIRASDAASIIGFGMTYTRKLLWELVEEGWLEPAAGRVRIHRFRLAQKGNKSKKR